MTGVRIGGKWGECKRREMNARNYIGKIHRSQILIGLLCPAMEFSLFPGVKGKYRS